MTYLPSSDSPITAIGFSTTNAKMHVKTPIQGMMIIDLQIATTTKVQIPPLKTNTFNNSRQMHVTI